jgi:hypothetical protein
LDACQVCGQRAISTLSLGAVAVFGAQMLREQRVTAIAFFLLPLCNGGRGVPFDHEVCVVLLPQHCMQWALSVCAFVEKRVSMGLGSRVLCM